MPAMLSSSLSLSLSLSVSLSSSLSLSLSFPFLLLFCYFFLIHSQGQLLLHESLGNKRDRNQIKPDLPETCFIVLGYVRNERHREERKKRRVKVRERERVREETLTERY